MNEAETRAEFIDPKLRDCGWGVVEGSKILREFNPGVFVPKNLPQIIFWFTRASS